MKLVKIRHAGVDGVAEVPESALPHHQAAGWERVVDESHVESRDEHGSELKSGKRRRALKPPVDDETAE